MKHHIAPVTLKSHQKTDIRYLLTLPRSIIPASGSTRNWQELELFPAISDRLCRISQRNRPENTQKRKQYSRPESTVPWPYDFRQIHKPESNWRPRKTGRKSSGNPLYPIRIRGGIKRIHEKYRRKPTISNHPLTFSKRKTPEIAGYWKTDPAVGNDKIIPQLSDDFLKILTETTGNDPQNAVDIRSESTTNVSHENL